jgi:hypothetical protein
MKASTNPRVGLNSAIPADIKIIDEYKEELFLSPILDLKSLLTILFKFVKREVIFELIEEGLQHNEIGPDIFELCLLHDEELSM